MPDTTNSDVMALLVAFREETRVTHAKFQSDIGELKEAVGDEESGLVKQVRELVSLKDKGLGYVGGVVAALTLFGVLIAIGIKDVVLSWSHH